MNLSKLFSTPVILLNPEDLKHQTLCKAVEDVLSFEFECLQDFLNGELHPLMGREIINEIFGFVPGSLQEQEFGATFDLTMDRIIEHYEDLLDDQSYPDFSDDYESEAQYSSALGMHVWKCVTQSLRCYVDDLVIAGLSLHYKSLKDHKPNELVL